MNLVFLISLPRAGSTLLQRLLMNHQQIASKSEPWIMLPLVYLLKPEGTVTEYNHQWSTAAIHDYLETLPNGRLDYEKVLCEFATHLYQLNCNNNEAYFLDKTPRYYLIIPELSRIFPEAKFIFLTRNPLQIVSSIITTFSNNRLRNLHFYQVDLFKGFNNIEAGIKLLGKRGIHVKYEELVERPNIVLSKIFEFLNLELVDNPDSMLNEEGLKGRFGDKWGVQQYSTIENKSVDKWKEVLNGYVRKIYVRRIISRIEEPTLAAHGYSKQVVLSELAGIKTKITFQSFQDVIDILRSSIIRFFYLNLYRKRIRNWTKESLIG